MQDAITQSLARIVEYKDLRFRELVKRLSTRPAIHPQHTKIMGKWVKQAAQRFSEMCDPAQIETLALMIGPYLSGFEDVLSPVGYHGLEVNALFATYWIDSDVFHVHCERFHQGSMPHKVSSLEAIYRDFDKKRKEQQKKRGPKWDIQSTTEWLVKNGHTKQVEMVRRIIDAAQSFPKIEFGTGHRPSISIKYPYDDGSDKVIIWMDYPNKLEIRHVLWTRFMLPTHLLDAVLTLLSAVHPNPRSLSTPIVLRLDDPRVPEVISKMARILNT